MNRVRQICATTMLAMVLVASPALAGDMPGGLTSPQTSTESSATGNLPMGDTSSSETSVTGHLPQGDTLEIDPVTGLALSLLKSLLSLF